MLSIPIEQSPVRRTDPFVVEHAGNAELNEVTKVARGYPSPAAEPEPELAVAAVDPSKLSGQASHLVINAIMIELH